MSDGLTDRVSFDKIRYANCWEDAEVLLKGLTPQKGDKILSIASGGDNSFALLKNDPELVLAVDISKVQLYLCELKKLVISEFEREEVISFLGFEPDLNRMNNFKAIKSQLSAEARHYFENRLGEIKKGIIHQGKFEKYFQIFSQYVLPFIHSQKRVKGLLSKKSGEEQLLFYNKHWNTWRWKMLFKLFFSKAVMGRVGRDPEFMNEVKIPVSNYIFGKAENHLQSVNAQENFILRYNLCGNFGVFLPYYLQKENFKAIKENIGQIKFREGGVQDFNQLYGPFHAMNLSNIFEYMNDVSFKSIGESLVKGLHPDARIAYWNLMVPRHLHRLFPLQVSYLQELSKELSAIDRGFFYHQIIIEKKI